MKRTSATTPRTVAAPRTVKSRASSRVNAPEPTTTVSESAIAMRAYEIFKSRNGEPGDPVRDWLQAERELRTST